MTLIQKHLIVHGRVQGVGYRWSMARAAEGLGVRGWVRNRRDGTVEALVVGKAAAVDAMVDWARRGPQQARVERVELAEAIEDAGAPEGFEQRGTV